MMAVLDIALVLPLAVGVVAAGLAARLRGRRCAVAGSAAAGVAFLAYLLVSAGAGEEAALTTAFWSVPSLGIAGGLRLDGLSLLFVLLITGIGALVLLYAGRYLQDDTRLTRLVVLLLVFMVAMLGAVTADNVITLFVFWELTSIASFLVGYDHEKPGARKAALQALLVTGSGGLALLAGLILVAMAAGTTSLSGIIAVRETVLAHPATVPAMLLVVLGCFTKSAQFPFHFWLPNAMAAPTPISAYLHSATMVSPPAFRGCLAPPTNFRRCHAASVSRAPLRAGSSAALWPGLRSENSTTQPSESRR